MLAEVIFSLVFNDLVTSYLPGSSSIFPLELKYGPKFFSFSGYIQGSCKHQQKGMPYRGLCSDLPHIEFF
jgi:hypothetical protein